MSCLTDRLSNINTTIYSSPGAVPPVPPMPPVPAPPVEMNNFPNDGVTDSYALFTNSLAPGETYAEGTNISFPTTVYNTDERNIQLNGGSVSLAGGRTGKTYLVMYQVSGTFTTATLTVTEDGVAQQASDVTVTGETTASGSYIVSVPPMQDSNVAVNVFAGSVATATPTAGTTLTVVRIA